MIVGGQSTTDDVIDINADLHSVVEEQASIIATLQAKVEKLEARQSSVMLSNRKLFSVKLCFVPCELIWVNHDYAEVTNIRRTIGYYRQLSVCLDTVGIVSKRL